MKTLKLLLRMAVALLLGCAVGFGGVMLCFVVFTDMSAADFLAKFQRLGVAEMALSTVLSLCALMVAFLLQVVIHEGGHLVCGLATGYRFVSFRVLHFTLFKRAGRWCVRRFDLAGTGGQCLLTPPDLPVEQIPVVLYNVAGVLANLLAVLLAGLLLYLVELPQPASLFCWQLCVVGTAFALLNGIPFPGSHISNDATNLWLMRHNPASKRALMTMLRINALVQEGVRPGRLPEEWVAALPTDYGDSLQINLKLMRIGWLMDNCRWEEADRELQECHENRDRMIGLMVDEVACEWIFVSLMCGHKEQAERLYTLPLRKYIGHYRRMMSSKQRVLFAAKLYLEENEAEAMALLEELRRKRDRYLMQGEVEMDLALMEQLLGQKGGVQ